MAVRRLGRRPVDVTLVDRRNHHLFQPLLYQVATGMLSPGQIAPPIRHVVRRFENVRVELAEVTGFDLERRIVHAATVADVHSLEVPYDSLIVGAGVNQSYTVQALGIDPLEAQIRQVFFFDTPSLDLNQAGVVVRAHRVRTRRRLGHQTPARRAGGLPAELRKSPNLVVEVDAMPGGYVCSASMKGTPARSVREQLAKGGRISKLFSNEQRGFFKRYAPDGSIWTG